MARVVHGRPRRLQPTWSPHRLMRLPTGPRDGGGEPSRHDAESDADFDAGTDADSDTGCRWPGESIRCRCLATIGVRVIVPFLAAFPVRASCVLTTRAGIIVVMI